MKVRRKLRHAKTHALGWSVLIAPALLALLLAGCLIGLWGVVSSWTRDLPSLDNADAFAYARQSYMYAGDGTTLLAEFQLEKRDPVENSRISAYALKGTVATEDVRFYEHDGVDPMGIARAVMKNLAGGRLEGASTITQQLVRNTVLSEEATDITIERKVREAALALEMEKRFDKATLLNMYLNTINYGDGCYGIQAAARNYFQVDAIDLTLTQAATLVGIPQSPTMLNPKEHPEACLARRNAVLGRMLADDVITQEEHDEAIKAPLDLNPEQPAPYQGIHAYPYFTSYVRDKLLEEGNKYGCSYADLFKGGLTIYTTLDPSLQDKAEAACAQQNAQMAGGLESSLVAMSPENGHVLAMVGGRNYESDQWNIATQGGRPPGSTFKVFTLIAALKAGISPQVITDCTSPLRLPSGQTIENFGGANYGKRTLASATAISSNTGYYRLAEKLGPQEIIDVAASMGIDQKLPSLPIITLGTEDATPLQMTAAYNTLAARGVYRAPVVISKIEDAEGNVIYESPSEGKRVLEEDITGATTKVLRGVFESGEGTARGFGPSNGQPVAGKTGTSSQFRDHWLVGYCPTLTCAAWIGNRDFSPTPESLNAHALWGNFMSRALEGKAPVPFPVVPDPHYTTLPAPEPEEDEDEEKDEGKDAEEIEGKDPRTAPNVVGMQVNDALSTLAEYWVYYSYVASDQPSGTVLSQSVDGKAVSIRVSRGSP
ncbi:PASTA domain-containing protein [Eggerthellaceae bacterium zg-997]|nr:PASTA domain-containing protein [Eggerthellaceae bacterium zg-997]